MASITVNIADETLKTEICSCITMAASLGPKLSGETDEEYTQRFLAFHLQSCLNVHRRQVAANAAVEISDISTGS